MHILWIEPKCLIIAHPRDSLLRNWSLVNSFCRLVVVKGRSEGVTLSFDINWWTLKLLVTLLRFGAAEIRKMNLRRWIHWKEMWLRSHYCWMPVPRWQLTECGKGFQRWGTEGSCGERKAVSLPLRDKLLADNSWWGRERGVVQWQAQWKDLQRPLYQCSLKELQQNLLGHQTMLTDIQTEGRQVGRKKGAAEIGGDKRG